MVDDPASSVIGSAVPFITVSIVKNILSHHGNRFGVSNENGGVRFYFTLPLHQ
jgi:hypothetical protein